MNPRWQRWIGQWLGTANPPVIIPLEVLAHAPFGYIQVDGDNCVVYANATACDLLATNPPTSVYPLLKWVRSYELDQLITQTRQQQQPLSKDWQWQTVIPDPEHPAPQPSRWLCGQTILLPTAQIGVYLSSRQEVYQLRQQCDRWLADVAHELKTPLTAMRLITETIHSRVDAPVQEWVDRLLREILRLSDLVQDVLDLNRNPTLDYQPIQLTNLVEAVWQNLQPIAQRRKVTLESDIPKEITLWGDYQRLYRLLLNLLDNAIKHSPSLQQVLITAESSPEMVIIDVIDCGQGFTADALDHAFERFYRGESAPSEGGSGLGLAIAKHIVELHQGQIYLLNHRETGGGQVRVYLPLQKT